MKKILLTAITLTCLLVGSSSVMACGAKGTPNDQGKNASVTWKTTISRSGIDVDHICNKTREIEGESPVEEQTGKAPEMESALKQESGEVKMAHVEPDQEAEAPNKGQETVPAEDREENKAAALPAALDIVDHSGSNSQRKTGFAMGGETHIQEVMDLGAAAHLSAIKGRIPFIDFSDGLRNDGGAPLTASNKVHSGKSVSANAIPFGTTIREFFPTFKTHVGSNTSYARLTTQLFGDNLRNGDKFSHDDSVFENKFFPESKEYEFHFYSLRSKADVTANHVLASGKDINIFVFDTEVYANTDGFTATRLFGNNLRSGKVVPVVITSYEDSVVGSKFPTVRSTRIDSKLSELFRKISFEQTGVGLHGSSGVTIPSSILVLLDDELTLPLIRRSGTRLPAGQMNRVIIQMGAIGEESAKNGLEYWLLRHSAADQLLTAELLPLVLPEAEIELVDRTRTNGITFVDFSRFIPKRLEKGIAENGLRNPRLCEVVYDQLLTAEPLPLVLPEEGRFRLIEIVNNELKENGFHS